MTKYLIVIFFLTLNVFASENSIRTVKVEVPVNFGTANFEIHAKRKNLAAAHMVEKILIEDSPKLLQYFEYIPRGVVHLSIDDLVDSANGAATPFPENLIFLNNYPASGDGHLATSDDWWRILVMHELTHIIHLDQTRGFPNIFRSVFGSVGKWNGVAPRWFSEGIAVWTESTFTENGRLRSPEVEMEVKRLIGRGDVCATLDCLDDPITYPNGQLAYWMGGHFMQWLEKNKANTVKCLVEANSDTIIFFFFLNSAFKECTGKTAGEKFREFISDYRQEMIKTERAPSNSNISLSEVGRIDWQNGRALLADKLYVTGVDYTAEAKDWLWELDVSNKKVQKYSLPQYVERVMPGDDELFLMFREGVYFTDKNTWGRWNISTQKLERLKFPEPVEYVYKIENQFYTIGFIDGMWVLKQRQENGDLKLIYTFPEFLTLRKPELRKVGENLVLTTKTYDYDQYAVKRFVFNTAELNFLRVENLISQKEVLSIAGECGGDLYQRPHDPHQVGFIEEKYFVDAKNSSLIQKVEKCSDYEKFGLKKVAVKAQETSSEVKLNLASTEDHFYPRPFHFLPHFWYPDLSINGKLSHVGASTTVSDPRGDHALSLGYDYAYNLKEHEPEFAYTNHQALALNHDLYSSIGYGKSYYRSSFSSFNESTENTFASLSLSQRFNSFLHFPTLFLQKQRREDFFSNRDQIIYGLQENFLLLPHKKNDLLGPLNLMGQFYRNDVDLYADYNTFQSKLQWDIKPSWQSKIHLQGSYGKNYKNSYSSGVLYAGGSGSDVVHEFYNVDNNNAYGNKMATWRVQYSHLLTKIYSGGSVFPLFVKDVSLFGGTERLYADNIYLKNHVIGKTQLQDIHGGARISANIFYLASVEFELVASTLVGGVDHDFRLLTLVNAGGF